MSRPTRPARPKRGGRGGARPAKSLHKIVTHKTVLRAITGDHHGGAQRSRGRVLQHSTKKVLKATGKEFARRMQIERKRRENLKYGPQMAAVYLPMAWEATFYVSKDQASWAEYLLERTQRVVVVSGGVDRRNRTWADRHDGVMPTPWTDPGCKEGKAIEKKWEELTDDN